MMSNRLLATLAAVCIAGGGGCAPSNDDEVDPSVSSAPSAESAAAIGRGGDAVLPSEFDGPPALVTLPDLDLARLSESLQDQIREQHAVVLQKSEGVTPPDELGDAYGELGMILMATGLHDTAANAYLNAHALSPTAMRWPYYLAQLSRQTGDAPRAIEFFERAVEIDPTYPAALVWLGEMYLDESRVDEAETVFDQALALEPESAPALSGIGRAALANGDAEKAVDYLERALEVGPTAWNLHYSLANAYRTLGELDKVEAHLEQRGGDPPQPADPLMDAYDGLLRSARAYENRGTQAMGEGRYDEAAVIFREGIAETPDDAGLRHWLGSALMMMGDTRGAGEQYQEALRLAPDYEDSHLGLGALLSASGRHREAVDRFRTAVELRPNYIQARLGLADALRATGRLEESLVQLERVVELDPSFVDVWMGRAMTLVELGQYREARDGLDQATLIHAGHPGLTDLLVRILAAAPDEGVRDGIRALALMQERFKGPVSLEMYETMAMALAEVGRYDEAANWQRQAMSAAEQNDRADVARVMANALALYEQGRPVRRLFGVAGP